MTKRILPLFFLICALPVSRALAQETFPPVTLPAGGLWFDTTGKAIAATAVQAAPVPVNEVNSKTIHPDGVQPGTYEVGAVYVTGNHIGEPYGLVSNLVLTAPRADGTTVDVSAFGPPSEPNLPPVRAQGKETTEWAGYLGYAEATGGAIYIDGQHPLGLRYGGGTVSLYAIRLVPVNGPADLVTTKIDTDAPDHAFYDGVPPKLSIAVHNSSNNPWTGQIEVDRYDMLTDTSTPDLRPAFTLPANGDTTLTYEPVLPYGVFRLTARGNAGGKPGTFTSSVVVANSPAKLAKDLPDDWPLGTHHSNPSPILKQPMPGFKWYRYFCSWSALNPAKGQYNWKELDATLGDITGVGGKLLLVFEGAPQWTSAKAIAAKQSPSRFAPDDMDDYRTFLRALVDRYEHTALGAIEVWNEYNANARWQGTWDELVDMHKVTYEETRRTDGRIKVVGITISPGHHFGYVEDLTERGVLNYCDIVGAHFYEEQGSLDRLNPRNSMPLHVDMLHIPMYRIGKFLPIWDTESGTGWENVNGGPRPGGRMESQDEMIDELEKRPNYNPQEPWLMWANSSERRMAAQVVSTTVSELGYGVEKHFTFHPNWYSFDHALNLPWVSNGTFGSVLLQVDYHYIMPVGVNAVGGADDIGAVCYRLGKPGEKQVLVVWAIRASTKHPHQAGWSRWIAPVPIQIPCAPGTTVQVQDLYLRGETPVQAQSYPGGEAVSVMAGEEPVFIWGWQDRDQ